MKKILLLFVAITAYNVSYSQDLMVYDKKDSLNCWISEMKNSLLYFNLIRDNKEVSTYLFLERVDSYTPGYFSNATTNIIHKKKDDYAHFRISVAGGYSFRTAELPDDISSNLRSYLKKVRNGFNYGIEAGYYFTEMLGVGINYYASHFSPLGFYWVPIEGNYVVAVSDKVRIFHVMPTFNMRVLDRKKQGALLVTLGIGYVDFKDKLYLDDINTHVETIKGSSAAIMYGIGYDIPISRDFAIYVQSSFVGGVIRKFKYIDEISGESMTQTFPDDQGEGLGRINLSVGLRFEK